MSMEAHLARATSPCRMKDCHGHVLVAATEGVQIRTSCFGFSMAYACDTCGRLYFMCRDGIDEVMSRSGEAAYLKDGAIENRPVPVRES